MLDARRSWTRNEEWKWGVREQEGGEVPLQHHLTSSTHLSLKASELHQYLLRCLREMRYDASAAGFYIREMGRSVHLVGFDACVQVNRVVWLSGSQRVWCCRWVDSASGRLVDALRRDFCFERAVTAQRVRVALNRENYLVAKCRCASCVTLLPL